MNAKNQRALELACATLDLEADAIRKMRDRLAQEGQLALLLSVDLLEQCRGRIVVSGIGKSGHIARKPVPPHFLFILPKQAMVI
jgi:arabinose-5-phosphate isomerase